MAPKEKEVSKQRTIQDFTRDEFLQWATGYILQELIKGNLISGVSFVLINHSMWLKEEEKRQKKVA